MALSWCRKELGCFVVGSRVNRMDRERSCGLVDPSAGVGGRGSWTEYSTLISWEESSVVEPGDFAAPKVSCIPTSWFSRDRKLKAGSFGVRPKGCAVTEILSWFSRLWRCTIEVKLPRSTNSPRGTSAVVPWPRARVCCISTSDWMRELFPPEFGP